MDNKLYKKYVDDIFAEQHYNHLTRSNFLFRKSDICWTEEDFYPLSDDRVLTSYIEDIDDGDNYADYCKYIFDLYEAEGYYDWL